MAMLSEEVQACPRLFGQRDRNFTVGLLDFSALRLSLSKYALLTLFFSDGSNYVDPSNRKAGAMPTLRGEVRK